MRSRKGAQGEAPTHCETGRARGARKAGAGRRGRPSLGSGSRFTAEERAEARHCSRLGGRLTLLPAHTQLQSPVGSTPSSTSRTSSVLPGQGPRFRRRGEGAPDPGARHSPERLSTSHSSGPQKIAAKANSSSRTRPAIVARSRLNTAPSATASSTRNNAAGSHWGAPRVSTARGGPGGKERPHKSSGSSCFLTPRGRLRLFGGRLEVKGW